jgi:hypothetical protein
MSIYAQAGVRPDQLKDLSPIPEELKLFARIEGLIGEEAALLAIPLQQRREEQRQRLKAISAELDRIWDCLRARARRISDARA